ncbi:unnamed protein product [Caenorhabditis sp. 36 PRJEB53466]|nr:unnamed protein product [Caenorhabditis sp. 36 PRJEB53466]
MLTCTHITADKCVERVPKDMFSKKKRMEDDNLFLEGNGNRGKVKGQETFKTFCDECDNCTKSLMCLSCGRILCGRDDLGHAVDHFNATEHPVVIDCITFELFCYSCDDEVSLDFEPSLYSVLKSLKLLFDRDDVIEGGEGTLPTAQTAKAINDLVDAFSTNARVESNKKGSKKKKGARKGKVSPMFDPPFQGNVINCSPASAPATSSAATSAEIAYRPRGLRNIGNTCFMNAVLQALASIVPFREYISNLPSLEEYVEEEKASKNGNCFLTDEFRAILAGMCARNFREPATPSDFREAFVSACPRFRGFRQHDSHEFMRYLLDQMHVEMKKCRFLPEMPEKSSVICQTCGNCSDKNDEFMDLSLDIPRMNKGRIRVSDCLNMFFEKEMLEKGEKPECGKCKTKQTSSKQMSIRRLPEVLCLHIKRFRDNGGKMDTLVEYPMSGLTVDEYLIEDSDEPPCHYDLQSIIVHIGYGCGSGHYIAFGKRGGKWYQFDDSVVKSVDNSLVSKQKAYVLLYTKMPVKP